MDSDWFIIIAIGAVLGWKVLSAIGFSFLRPPMVPSTGGRFYWVFGLTVLILFSAVEFWGYGYLDADKIRNVPKNVRENPGVYRSHYRSYGRTFGGK
jgi:hypothetical protein